MGGQKNHKACLMEKGGGHIFLPNWNITKKLIVSCNDLKATFLRKSKFILLAVTAEILALGVQEGFAFQGFEDLPELVSAVDTNWAVPRMVDDFEYDYSPLAGNWGVFDPDSGAQVTTVYDSELQSRVMQSVTSEGEGFGIYFPKTTGGITAAVLNVRRKHLYFRLKTSKQTFSATIRINRQHCAINYIVYKLTQGIPYVSQDSVIIPLGSSLADGQWHEIIRDLDADLHKGFTGESFEVYFLALRGDFMIDGIVLRNRPLIEGYAGATGIPQGNPIDFKVSVNRNGNHTFRIEFYREGAERELFFTTPNIPGSEQPVSLFSYRDGAGWPISYILSGEITRNWRSGMYIAKLISDLNDSSFVPFVILEDEPGSTSNILLQFSTTTYQAYNFWGGGSMYDGYDTIVSFDRPYSELWYGPWADASGAGQFYAFEQPLVRWLEGQGYMVEYVDNVNLNDPAFHVDKYRMFISVGHDEYWYEPARDKLEYLFRDTLHNNLAFFSANSCYWRVREPVPNPKRQMITNKGGAPITLDLWRSLLTNGVYQPRPEAALIGVMYSGLNVRGQPATIAKASHWIFRGTGLKNGDQFGFGQGFPEGIGGYEGDVMDPSSPNGTEFLAFARNIQQCSQSGIYPAYTAFYQHAGGSEVFASGGIQWSWGLMDADSGTVRVTKNIIDGLASTMRGRVSNDTVWGGRVYLGGDVTIDSGVTLMFEPGTEILFFANNDVERSGRDTFRTELIVKGNLVALGSPSDSIIFSSAQSFVTNDSWGGVSIFGSGKAAFSFCRFSHAQIPIFVKDTSGYVKVRDCTFNNFKLAAVVTGSLRVDLGISECGRNNFLMKSASQNATAINLTVHRSWPVFLTASSFTNTMIQSKKPIPSRWMLVDQTIGSSSPPPLYVKGNWWDSSSPPSEWFSAGIDPTPYLLSPAIPEACQFSDSTPFTTTITKPKSFYLGQNYPNPFNGTTYISYELPFAANVQLDIFNLLGQKVQTLVKESQTAGLKIISWDGTDFLNRTLSSGIYVYQIQTRTFRDSKKMMLLR